MTPRQKAALRMPPPESASPTVSAGSDLVTSPGPATGLAVDSESLRGSKPAPAAGGFKASIQGMANDGSEFMASSFAVIGFPGLLPCAVARPGALQLLPSLQDRVGALRKRRCSAERSRVAAPPQIPLEGL